MSGKLARSNKGEGFLEFFVLGVPHPCVFCKGGDFRVLRAVLKVVRYVVNACPHV
jgi:hypothetical protein